MKRYLLYGTKLYALPILRPLQEEILRRNKEVAWFYHGPGSEYFREDEQILPSVESVKRYSPDAVFVASNKVPDFFPGVKVQVFHGFDARKRKSIIQHYPIRGFFDLYCTQGPDTTINFKILAKKHRFFEVVETGWPKIDPLFTHELKEKPDRKETFIYFASTFTKKLSAALPLLSTIRRLSTSNKWQWIVNFHCKMDKSITARYKDIENSNLKVIETEDIIPLLKKADIMVSDTSSILSEFLLLNKPVVTFRNRRPGPHLVNISNPDDLEGAIEHALKKPKDLMEAIHRYTDEIHPYRDGKSSMRVLDATDRFIKKGRDHLRKKPLNLIRRIKVRRQLGYYRIW